MNPGYLIVHLTILSSMIRSIAKKYRNHRIIIPFYILLMDKENTRPQSSIIARNTHQNHKKTIKPSLSASTLTHHSRKDFHDQYMRFLIANNAEYFHSKLQVAPKGKPKDVRLKIPCRTGMTIYKKDFRPKEAKYNKEEDLQHNISTIDCIKTNNFLKDDPKDIRINDKTMYQKEFRYQPVRTESCRLLKRRLETSETEEDKAPRFLDTQNKIDFLNWAGKSYVPSMKPHQKPAVTNLPFDATSVYKTDFEFKKTPHTPIFLREGSYPNFGSVSMMMKSNYSCQFSEKKGGCEVSCKPRHIDSGLCKLFKGTTEYKREFILSRKLESEQDETCKTLEDMQTFIIDL